MPSGERVYVGLNVGALEDLKRVSPDHCDGIGLVRLVNGLGATPLLELYLLYDCVQAQLKKRNVRIARSLVGHYVTSLEMAGCSLTVSIVDGDLIKWWDAPVHTAALRWQC